MAVGNSDGSVKLWDIPRRTLVTSFKHGDVGGVTAVAFSARRQLLASAGTDWTITLWDLRRRTALATLGQFGAPPALL